MLCILIKVSKDVIMRGQYCAYVMPYYIESTFSAYFCNNFRFGSNLNISFKINTCMKPLWALCFLCYFNKMPFGAEVKNGKFRYLCRIVFPINLD